MQSLKRSLICTTGLFLYFLCNGYLIAMYHDVRVNQLIYKEENHDTNWGFFVPHKENINLELPQSIKQPSEDHQKEQYDKDLFRMSLIDGIGNYLPKFLLKLNSLSRIGKVLFCVYCGSNISSLQGKEIPLINAGQISQIIQNSTFNSTLTFYNVSKLNIYDTFMNNTHLELGPLSKAIFFWHGIPLHYFSWDSFNIPLVESYFFPNFPSHIIIKMNTQSSIWMDQSYTLLTEDQDNTTSYIVGNKQGVSYNNNFTSLQALIEENQNSPFFTCELKMDIFKQVNCLTKELSFFLSNNNWTFSANMDGSVTITGENNQQNYLIQYMVGKYGGIFYDKWIKISHNSGSSTYINKDGYYYSPHLIITSPEKLSGIFFLIFLTWNLTNIVFSLMILFGKGTCLKNRRKLDKLSKVKQRIIACGANQTSKKINIESIKKIAHYEEEKKAASKYLSSNRVLINSIILEAIFENLMISYAMMDDIEIYKEQGYNLVNIIFGSIIIIINFINFAMLYFFVPDKVNLIIQILAIPFVTISFLSNIIPISRPDNYFSTFFHSLLQFNFHSQ